MRKYRGKRVDNGEWVYGSLLFVPYTGMTYMFPDTARIVKLYEIIQVDPNTVGQWTGETDGKKTEIYKGDKLRLSAEEPYLSEGISTDYDWELEGVVIWRDGCFWIRVDNERKVDIPIFDISEGDISTEVIGNIHDNPELWR